jgi:hypothetical protein
MPPTALTCKKLPTYAMPTQLWVPPFTTTWLLLLVAVVAGGSGALTALIGVAVGRCQ